MLFVLNPKDVSDAPAEVKAWLVATLTGETTETEAKPAKAKRKKAKAEPQAEQAEPQAEQAEPEPEAIELPKLIEAATRLIESEGGADTLAHILGRMKIRRVKECPPERYAELLAEIATHA